MQTLAGSSDRESMIRVSKKLLSNMAALRELALELTGEEWTIKWSDERSDHGSSEGKSEGKCKGNSDRI